MNEDKDFAAVALLLVMAIIFPPLAVGLRGGLSLHLALSLLLTIFLYLPGQVHACWYVLRGGNE